MLQMFLDEPLEARGRWDDVVDAVVDADVADVGLGVVVMTEETLEMASHVK